MFVVNIQPDLWVVLQSGHDLTGNITLACCVAWKGGGDGDMQGLRNEI